MKKTDPFVQAPEFLAAFNHVLANGFFENMKLEVLGYEGSVHELVLKASGYIPNRKSSKKGVGALFDPEAIIASCKQIAFDRGIKRVNVTIERKNWPIYSEDHIVGSRGEKVDMKIEIWFKP